MDMVVEHKNSNEPPLFGALDLGTNSCRMLIAQPQGFDFKVMDAFSKTVYLGRGLDKSGRLNRAAQERTISALSVCASKLKRLNVQHSTLVATAACRLARNGADFVALAKKRTGLDLQIIKPQEEARLAVIGSASHLRRDTDQVMVIDIGGGSTEMVWLDVSHLPQTERRQALLGLNGNLKRLKGRITDTGVRLVDWISVPLGVTTLREQFNDVEGDKARYAMMSWAFEESIAEFGPFGENYEGRILPNFQIIGTSGTVTTIAATHMKLQRYDRAKVDGYEMSSAQVEYEISKYLARGPKWRASNPAIGAGRKDLIMSGAAILQAVLRVWPTDVLTVADRGLREGMLYSQMVRHGFLN